MARSLTAASSVVVLALVADRAHAQGQSDLNPPLPDVLLLVDNSGSMERMIDGTLPEDKPANACDVSQCLPGPTGTTCTWAANAPAAANRWNVVLQSLVGSPTNGYHCVSMPRTASTTFTDEYQINGTLPYDASYYLNYHRAVAKDTTTSAGNTIPCVYAPGTLPGAAAGNGVGMGKFGTGTATPADAFPAGAIITRPYGQTSVDQNTKKMACQFSLNGDGSLLVYQDLMRFGLMTFDQDPSQGTGVSASAPLTVNSSPFTGMWSYFPNWTGGGAPQFASGNPLACSSGALPFEVGARNPAAPPWEGRMVPFPPPDETQSGATSARQGQNQQIRSVLSATRPYGGTPLAGLMTDAMYYFWNDPNGPNGAGGAQYDGWVQNGCRKQFIILLTDGVPNQDLRESCGTGDNPSAPCPYDHPDWTAQTLVNGTGGHKPVETFVIGFAVSSGKDQGGTLVQCSQLDPTSADCTNPTPQLAPCCQLQKIAVAGGPPAINGQPAPHAFFADTPGDLQAALGAILAQIAQASTTRTVPAYSPSSSNAVYTANSTVSNQNTFYSSFNPARPVPNGSVLSSAGAPWTGNVQRSRYLCSQNPQVQAITVSQGDDFRQNLANASSRNFIAFQPAAPVDASATIRPFVAATVGDGLGKYGGTQVAGGPSTITSSITAAALNLPTGASSCQYTSDQGQGQPFLSDSQCASMLLDFTMGQTFSGGPSDFPFVSRTGINAFGGVYHATPAIVGPPTALVHDDSYDAFSTSAQTTAPGMAAAGTKVRDTIAYVATTDGLLHAFWTDIGKLASNEEWAFLPPAVMPQLRSSYPASNQFLLDGSPIVKDVVWDRPLGKNTSPSGSGYNPWRTTLVAGFGPSQRGYYAVDVTNPVFTTTTSTESAATDPTGPVFLWQLTKMPSTNMPLFGQHGATPAVTQVAINVGGSVHDVGVAILPGGWDTAAVAPASNGTSGCERDSHHRSLADWNVPSSNSPTYAYRNAVRCWGSSGNYADAVTGRSVTIVRLDTGEILATFMRKYDATQYHASDTLLTANPSRIIDTPLDSPMTGTPVVYPSLVGANATRFFMGDIDGTIWRFDISDPDSTKWSGRLYFDMYNTTADTTNGTGVGAWNDGQPMALPMVTSVDRVGRLVLHAASGSQETFDSTGPNFLVSLTEKAQGAGANMDFRSSVNWFMGSKVFVNGAKVLDGVMDTGERVSGPMVVFDSKLYFTTYSANITAASVCSQGDARLWGADYIVPNGANSPPSLGGAIVPPTTGSNPYLDLTTTGVGAGVVVPGVSVQQSTACVQVTSGVDQYVPGATHSSISSYTPGTFSLVAEVGSPSNSGGVTTVQRSLPPPNSPSVFDSWASVAE